MPYRKQATRKPGEPRNLPQNPFINDPGYVEPDYSKPIKSNTHMSYWDNYQAPEGGDSIYLSSVLGESGSSAEVQFIGMQEIEQSPDAQYPTSDGKQWQLTFKMEDGTEKLATQNTLNGRLITALRKEAVQPGQVVELTRVGEGTGTNYLVKKLDKTFA